MRKLIEAEPFSELSISVFLVQTKRGREGDVVNFTPSDYECVCLLSRRRTNKKRVNLCWNFLIRSNPRTMITGNIVSSNEWLLFSVAIVLPCMCLCLSISLNVFSSPSLLSTKQDTRLSLVQSSWRHSRIGPPYTFHRSSILARAEWLLLRGQVNNQHIRSLCVINNNILRLYWPLYNIFGQRFVYLYDRFNLCLSFLYKLACKLLIIFFCDMFD